MARKIRFPLQMKNGIQVRTLEELKDNFDLESVLGYFENGKLATWLKDRYYDDMAEQIESLDVKSNFNRQLCDILGIEYEYAEDEINLENSRIRNERLMKLRQYTDDKDIIQAIDSVAFDQDELFDRLDEGSTVIFLCGERFSIPLGKTGITYIGVNEPIAVINSKKKIDWSKKNIILKNVHYDEKYQKIEAESKTPENGVKKSAGSIGGYCRNTVVNFMLSASERAAAEALYQKIADEVHGIQYDPDADTNNLHKMLASSGLYDAAMKYISEL